MKKRVVFIADSLDNAYKFQQVLSGFEVEIAAGSTVQIPKLLASSAGYDLIIFEARGSALPSLADIVAMAEDRICPLLVIVDAENAGSIALPVSGASDFVVHGAGHDECCTRVRRLLGAEGTSAHADLVSVDDMAINLATYQVTVGGEPVDFTYLEYALLSFLVRHAGHTFSRDALLQHVWGFDYYGGSRTVDVHVRRIRAKLGPELAQHLETVRGVGYLWSTE
ncbi:MAG: winged helix-turn-helix domain-containing protein [Eggerthellaceae bacterium]|nr:winged helix-turn-helix domain-containing protein [Eggerthellaceae bacterium]